jgi:hypothetical protein
MHSMFIALPLPSGGLQACHDLQDIVLRASIVMDERDSHIHISDQRPYAYCTCARVNRVRVTASSISLFTSFECLHVVIDDANCFTVCVSCKYHALDCSN